MYSQWRSRMAADLTSIMVFAMSSGPAAAWGPISGTWDFSGGPDYLYFCEDASYPFPYQSMWDTLKAGFARWNATNSKLKVYEQTTQPCDIFVHYEAIGPASTTALTFTNGHISRADIYFNKTYGGYFYWYQSTQNCYVGINGGCYMDAWTVATHEMGHALGLTHNTSPDNDQRCYVGYYSNTGSGAACYSYGLSIMHWNAGTEFENGQAAGKLDQGYRHLSFSSDDQGAINLLNSYYP